MKKVPFLYFIYAVFAVALFLWIIFGLSSLFARLASSSLATTLFVLAVAAILSATALILAISAASPLVNDFLVTLRRLLRMDNLSNPLLMKLSLTAPGTYHHSINVSNLAQKAAKTIGADSLLVRVAAYYHDIGKLDNPEFFIENQSEEDKNAINLSPQKSAKTIISHVEKGLKFASTNNLSEDICDLISQHHGTTLVNYFFEIARANDSKTQREDYRYPGPKPSSKESGILMLADSVEAAIRSIKDVTSEDIEKVVNQVIAEKTEQEQLVNSGLSDKDLQKIRVSLIETLGVMYHRRIVK